MNTAGTQRCASILTLSELYYYSLYIFLNFSHMHFLCVLNWIHICQTHKHKGFLVRWCFLSPHCPKSKQSQWICWLSFVSTSRKTGLCQGLLHTTLCQAPLPVRPQHQLGSGGSWPWRNVFLLSQTDLLLWTDFLLRTPNAFHIWPLNPNWRPAGEGREAQPPAFPGSRPCKT